MVLLRWWLVVLLFHAGTSFAGPMPIPRLVTSEVLAMDSIRSQTLQ